MRKSIAILLTFVLCFQVLSYMSTTTKASEESEIYDEMWVDDFSTNTISNYKNAGPDTGAWGNWEVVDGKLQVTGNTNANWWGTSLLLKDKIYKDFVMEFDADVSAGYGVILRAQDDASTSGSGLNAWYSGDAYVVMHWSPVESNASVQILDFNGTSGGELLADVGSIGAMSSAHWKIMAVENDIVISITDNNNADNKITYTLTNTRYSAGRIGFYNLTKAGVTSFKVDNLKVTPLSDILFEDDFASGGLSDYFIAGPDNGIWGDWSKKEGKLQVVGNSEANWYGSSILTENKYQDFVMEFDADVSAGYGVILRAQDDANTAGSGLNAWYSGDAYAIMHWAPIESNASVQILDFNGTANGEVLANVGTIGAMTSAHWKIVAWGDTISIKVTDNNNASNTLYYVLTDNTYGVGHIGFYNLTKEGVTSLKIDNLTIKGNTITLNTTGTLSTIKKGETIWLDKAYTFYEVPTAFEGVSYVQNVMKSDVEFDVWKEGYVYILTPYRGHANSIANQLDDEPYYRIETPAWYLASFGNKVDTWVYERQVKVGESISIPGNNNWHMVAFSEQQIDPTMHKYDDVVFSNDEMAVLEPTEASGDTVGTVKKGEHPFSNRTSGENEATFGEIPYCMQGKAFIYNELNSTVEATVTKSGKVLLLGSNTDETRKQYFTETLGFTYIGDMSSYGIIDGGSYSGKGYGLYIKDVVKDETITWGNGFWFIPMFYSDETLPEEPSVSIEITKMPDKTTYKLGEDFDPTGMVVTGIDKSGNERELDSSEYVTVPNTFTADAYAASVIVDDMIQAVPVTITDENGVALPDNNEYRTQNYSTQQGPVLNGSVKRSTTDEVIAAIEKMEADGATAFNVHLTELSEEYQNAESFRQIAECTDYPVMAIAYGNESNREWRIEMQKTAVQAGFDIVDIPMNTFDADSQSTLTGTVFETANPKEVSMSADVIEQQKTLIQEFHDLGAEVLISAHVGVSLSEEEGVALGKEMENRGADVAKIVLGSDANSNQQEVMQTNQTLKNELGIEFYYNASDTASKPYRIASTLIGTHMIFCYAEYHSSNISYYDYITDLVEFYDTIPRIKEAKQETKPMLKVNNSATLAKVAVNKKVWTDKNYVFTSLPEAFYGKKYVKASYGTSGETVDVTVLQSGYLYVLTNAYKMTNSQGETLDNLNYEKLDLPTWQFCNFTSTTSSVWVYEKYVEAGETLQLDQWSVVIASKEKLDLTDNGGYTVSDSELAVVKSLSDQTCQTLEVGGLVFSGGTSSTYKFYGVPYWLAGKNYIVSDYEEGGELEVTRAGKLYMLANATETRNTYFAEEGFTKIEVPSFEPFGGSSFGSNGYALYEKQVEVGEVISWDEWAVPIYSGELILSDNMAMLEPQGEYTEVSKFEFHARLFSDRTYYETTGSPELLYGKSYLYADIDNDGGETATGVVTKAGTVYVQIPTKNSNSTYTALEEQLIADGFTQTPYRTYRNNRKLGYAQRLYQKEVAEGDVIHYGKYNLVFFDTLENEEDYYVMPSLTTAAEIINNPQGDEYISYNRNWQGCPVITQTENGRLWAGWFTGGEIELATGNHAVLLYSDDNGKTWVDPAVAIVHPDTAVQVTKPQVWAMEDGRLWVSWTQHTGTGDFDGKMGTWAAICENPDEAPENLIWSEPIRLFDGRGNGKITVIQKDDGTEEWLTTAFDWMERDYSKVYSSTDGGATWTFKGKAEVTGSNYNNAILIEREDNSGGTYLWMLMRQSSGPMKESFSYDGGVTWTNGKTSNIDHPNSAIYMGWTSTGKLLMINHKDFTGRNNLTAFLSDDGGETWAYSLLLDERTGVSYPDVVEGTDGTFYIVYDYDRFNTGQIYMATVTEEDIMAGEFQSAEARQKVRISSIGIFGPQVSDELEKIDLSDKYTWASSFSTDSKDASAAFDEDTNTRWCASDSTLPQQLKIDLENEYDIGAIYIFFEQKSDWDYTLETSLDDVDWEVYAQPGSQRLVDVTEIKEAKARYVRLTVNGTTDDAWASVWEMEIYTYPKANTITEDANGAKIEFLGGSLRMDYTDYAKTSLRFGYRIQLPEGATLKSWSWQYTTANPSEPLEINGVNKIVNQDGTITANLVITGVPDTYYSLALTAKMKIEYVLKNGTVCTLEENVVRERSVNTVAEKILESQEATQDEKKYAENILQQ